MRYIFGGCIALTGIIGCEGGKNATADSAAPVAVAATSVAVQQTSAGSTGNPCAHNGRWATCTVERRLRQAGFVAKRDSADAPRREGFSVKPVVYSLGRAHLEVFIYDDEQAVARDMAGLDTVLVAPRGKTNAWEGTPMLIRSGNLAAVMLTQNARQAERLMLALTAGAPQPGSPR